MSPLSLIHWARPETTKRRARFRFVKPVPLAGF
jgi:hypothetical protein